MDLQRGIFLLLIAVLLVLSVAMVLPFLQYFLFTLLLVYLLLPIQRRLEERFSSAIAAGAIVATVTIIILVPLVYISWRAVQEATTLVDRVRSGNLTLEEPERRIEDATGLEMDLNQQLQNAVGEVAIWDVTSLVDTLVHALLGLGLTLFLLYYFLKDRKKFIGWLYQTVPLSDNVQDRLYTEIDGMMKALFIGHVFVAVVQGVLAGLGLLVTGVPNAVLWTVVMIVLSLLPIIGSFLVWGPAVIYLFLQGEPVLGVALFVWGTVIVGISDDYLRPIVVDRYANVNPSVIIIGVLGGIFVFGVMGIFFGPLIIGLLRVSLDVYREEFGHETEQLDPT